MQSKPRINAGTTLVELMIAVALIGIISLGIVGVFSSLSKGIQSSKSRTLASNLAQEQIQIIKQKSFNRVLVTTATIYIPAFSPNIRYDPGYYPPENILEGSITFTRYTFVEVVGENSGALNYLGAIADTGMKAITVTITWYQGTELKKLQVRNIIASNDTAMQKAVFQGKVAYTTNTSVGIPGALVTVAENIGWQDTANSAGNYLINLTAGSYRVVATAKGFFTQYVNASVSPNASATLNFNMVAMGTGTVSGTAWINDHLVISHVVGSTVNALGFCSEFVEVYNPSTFTWNIQGNVDLRYQHYGDASSTVVPMVYVSTFVNARTYYLFANTTTIRVAGVTRNADAVYTAASSGYTDLIYTSGGCGGGAPASSDSLGLSYVSDNSWIDRVGWRVGANNPPFYEGTPMIKASVLQEGEEFIRRTSTGGASMGIGRAYDSGSNGLDLFSIGPPVIFPVRSTADSEQVIAGTPAYGTVVTSNDGLSQSATAYSFGSPPVAMFRLTSVATGTWTVVLSSGLAEMEVSTVVVTANATTYITNSVTWPAAVTANPGSVILSTTATQGFISGTVKDALGVAINIPSNGISVGISGGNSTNANTTSGIYFLRLSSGTYDITANAGNASSSYVSQTSAAVTVTLGAVSSNVNFTLSQGGRVEGYVTRDGTNALPGVSIIALDANDVSRDQEVSGSNGRFYLLNLTTGVYTVEPVLGSGEAASPSSATVTVTAGSLVSVGTFTITGSFGSIRGSVSASSLPIRTGVLVVCTTTTISGAPPTLNFAALTGAGYYMTNSYEDGTYSMDVLASTSTTYKLYAYYTTFTGSTSSTTVRSLTGISVTAGLTTSGVNFSW